MTTTPITSVAVELPAHDDHDQIGSSLRRTWHVDVTVFGPVRVGAVPDTVTLHEVQRDSVLALDVDEAEHLGRSLLAAAADARARTEGGT